MTKAEKDKQLADGAADIKKAKGDTTATPAMEIHPVAKMFPTLPAKEMRELKASIEEHGIEVPILVNRAKNVIIDGRNRWMIAQDLGLTDIPMETFKGKDDEIPNVVLMRNVFRRHLTPDQRIAMITKVLAPQLRKEAEDRKAKKGSFGAPKGDGKGKSVAEELAEKGDVSTHKAKQSLKALDSGQIEEVIKGKSLKGAAKSAGTKTRPPKKGAAKVEYIDVVHKRWRTFITGFPHERRTEVRQFIRGFIVEELAEKK